MNKEDFKLKTKKFSLQIIRFVESLPRNQTAYVLAKQLLRSGTSVGANYRAACRARSTAEFIAKMGIVEEEADESMYWMELLVEAEVIKNVGIKHLMVEANEIVAMTVASIRTSKRNK